MFDSHPAWILHGSRAFHKGVMVLKKKSEIFLEETSGIRENEC